MAIRRDNPARRALTDPAVTTAISADDLEKARAAWRRHAPRRFWGLVDAKPMQQPSQAAIEPPAGS